MHTYITQVNARYWLYYVANKLHGAISFFSTIEGQYHYKIYGDINARGSVKTFKEAIEALEHHTKQEVLP